MKLKKLLLTQAHWVVCAISIFCATVYWGWWATDRYVSHADVVLQSPEIAAPSLDFNSLLSGGSTNTSDMLLLRAYLRSTDMLSYLTKHAGFREHYSNASADYFSRLSDKDAPLEKLHKYYLDRVSVELDDYAGLLTIDVEAFTPQKAKQIAEMLISQGESHMNDMGRRLAEEQVKFLDGQVLMLKNRYNQARESLVNYQNNHGLVSPSGTIDSVSSVVASLEGELAKLKAQKSALLSFQSKQSSEVVRVDSQIQAVEKQIKQERERLAMEAGGALNSISSEYRALELQAKFAEEAYQGAMGALENTRIEAARKLKQLSILQSPTTPEYAEKPDRIYDITVFIILALFFTLIVNMLILIVKDHRD